MAVLPDPTSDLDWSGYVGAIHDIFAANAQEHPDRPCVVETKSSERPERVFTYRQIYEASNVLAHHLHEAGVTNGDIVMVWAHRGVDLVISMMAVLASAATLSILDPAYPPSRQVIYLKVSQPCALINLARATEEAGPLAPIVRKYVDEELTLKTEVSALRIQDDGSLHGDDSSGHDIFARVRAKASTPPDTLVGPDSNPTLSFTSGSEGIPKGAKGRHFSLTKYFGFMAKTFDLSVDSKITMLSGIAHDPIQRDILTPLYLGAQILVPDKEDIQHERLAEWMREYKPTVTHLTPAMGQILVGGATAQFPSLAHAFFVGDQLNSQDCKRLRELAVNVNIINMYGTTETQRSVSYYPIPSRAKDPNFLDKLGNIVPVGRGMENVQLLVLNTQDRTKVCEVGEIGEIYVRAAGLAEGYMNDPKMTEEKFLANWFIDNEVWVEKDKKADKGEPWRKYYKGPRDRLYRTGDLGRYLPSGDVECTGRADDGQVKIRGFRIELGSIDACLSQHPLIRDCKTLVRRDRREEPILVSYIVPEIREWPQWLRERGLNDTKDEGMEIGPTRIYTKRFRRMQDEVRDHLKGQLPSYSVPTVYLVLSKLPLNPNGKVDKPKLPFPDIAEQVEEATSEDLKRWDSLTETERAVATRWSNLIHGLNAKTIRPDNDFFDLGGHSILAQQMLLDVRRQVGANVSINTLYEHPKLSTFSAEVDKRLRAPNGVNGNSEETDEDSSYGKSLDELIDQLPTTFTAANPATIRASARPTVFLTGATGFLGAYIIKDVLERTNRSIKLIAHVRGAKSPKAAFERLQRSLQGHGIWQQSWTSRLSCVVGDLSRPQLGIDHNTWDRLAQEVDIVIHNGAMVHWVRRYADLKSSNVLSTIDAIRLCNEGKPKLFAYVSSTSALDTDYYVKLSERQLGTGQDAILEEDDLQGSRKGLGTGYGQTKWVSEQLVREAGRRGLHGSIIRPGYVLGDAETGVCNSDDYLIRMLKGCIQVSSRPRIINTVNCVPVNHVARVVVAAALNPIPSGVHVVHVTGHPRLRMNEYLSLLEYYGFKVPETSYSTWKDELERYISAGGQEKDQEQHALMPLYHFCVNDLPATTRAPELDDRNAVSVLKADADNWTGVDESVGYGVTRDDVGRFLRFLAETKFIDWPTGRGRPLPEINLTAEQLQAVGAMGGRGGNAR